MIKGIFVVEATRNLSPAGADRLFQLLTSHSYDSDSLFRVQIDSSIAFPERYRKQHQQKIKNRYESIFFIIPTIYFYIFRFSTTKI